MWFGHFRINEDQIQKQILYMEDMDQMDQGKRKGREILLIKCFFAVDIILKNKPFLRNRTF